MNWKAWSIQYIGYNAPQTEVNEMYVATKAVQKWLEQGHDEATIFRKWNGGDGRIKSGVNKFGVKFDTGLYAQKALAYFGE